MKHIILIAFFVSSIGIAEAQSSAIDSLFTLLSAERVDTSRARILLNLSFQYGRRQKTDSSVQYAYEALKVADKNDYTPISLSARNYLGNVYGTTGNYVQSLKLLLEAQTLAQKQNDTASLRISFFYFGHLYKRQKDFRRAANYYAESLEVQSGSGLPELNLGEVYLEMGIFDSALAFVQAAYAIMVRTNSRAYLPGTLSTLGRIHQKLGNTGLGRSYLSMAEFAPRIVESRRTTQRVYLDLSRFFANAGDKDSSIHFARKSFMVPGGEIYKPNMLDAATQLALLYEGYNTDSAYKYLKIQKALEEDLLSDQKSQQMQALKYEALLKEQQLELEKEKLAEERRHNLQYAAIALAVVAFVLLFLFLSHSVIANEKLIRFLGILALLVVFEFINLFIHPYLDRWTGHSIPMMLGIMVCIAALLIPLHHKLEHWITHKLVEKNKRIRLAAARNTIAQLETNEHVSSITKTS